MGRVEKQNSCQVPAPVSFGRTGRWHFRLPHLCEGAPALSLPRVIVGAGPQRPAGLVGADDDARAHSLRADEREFAWRGSLRKDTFAGA